LFNQISDIGGDVEFYSYPGDDHNLSIAFSLVMMRSIQFFDEHVKNAVP
jgi:hypothetical protein